MSKDRKKTKPAEPKPLDKDTVNKGPTKLTPAQAGEKLGMRRDTDVLELFAEGRLPSVKDGDNWFIGSDLLDRAIAGEFKKGQEKFPALFVPGRGLRLVAFNGTRLWVSPTKTVRCPSF